MRSYYAHLEMEQKTTAVPRPVFRSSALFPMIQSEGISSRVLFFGYWILKRELRDIACVVSVRDESGGLVARRNFSIREAKCYRMELKEFLEEVGLPADSAFTGSMELEFFSTVDLHFSYPACVVNYYGPQFSSVVHTAQRVYNDWEDEQRNSQQNVPEGGFNIYADGEREPFFALVNGPRVQENSVLDCTLYNSKGECREEKMELGDLQPYETRVVYPARIWPLESFLGGEVGSAKVRFQLAGVFPRLVVGNLQRSLPALSITHSYYDCSKEEGESDYWLQPEETWHSSALLVPVLAEGRRWTRVYFYPLYSPTTFCIDAEIYDPEGNKLGEAQEVAKVHSPREGFTTLSLSELCHSLRIAPQPSLGARLIARAEEGERIPARIKIGLDWGAVDGMPCNICTNLQPFLPQKEGRHSCFRWAPILADQKSAFLWVVNSAPHRTFTHTARVDWQLFREKDGSTLQGSWELAPHGFQVVSLGEEAEWQEFLQGNVGWVTCRGTNPYLTTYYFAESAAHVFGGDHGF